MESSKLPKGSHSELLRRYSDWHKDLPKTFYLTDIDSIEMGKILLGDVVSGDHLYRKWVEIRRQDKLQIAIVDIKNIETEDKGVTWAEGQVYDFFNRIGIPVFIVWTNMKLDKFKVRNYETGQIESMAEEEYINFLKFLKGYSIEE